jgi:HAD superfamily hydrolase (TIGR01549 family)
MSVFSDKGFPKDFLGTTEFLSKALIIINGGDQMLNDIRAVIFDAGSTLGFPDWKRINEIAERTIGLRFDEDALQRKLYEVLARADTDKQLLREVADKKLPVGWDMRNVFSGLGVEAERLDELMAALNNEHQKMHFYSVANEDAIPVLSELKGRGMRLGVISNSTDGMAEQMLRILKVIPYLDTYVDSYRVGLAKPDPEIFLRTVRELGVAPAESLYVGDSYNIDVLGAVEAGLRGILFDPYQLQTKVKAERIASLRELLG